MAADKFTSNTIYDALAHFEAGMNSGVAVTLLKKNQLAFASAATVRGTYVHPRPAERKLALTFVGGIQTAFETGKWQGACFYQPDGIDPQYLVCSISGRLYTVVPSGSTAVVTDVTGANSQLATATQCWLWQAEKWVVWNDGTSLPVFYDGATTTRSTSTATVTYSKVLSNDLYLQAPVAIGNPFTIYVSGYYNGAIGDVIVLGGPALNFQFKVTAFTIVGPASISVDSYNVILPGGGLVNIVLPAGTSVTHATPAITQLPAGRMGCYGLGRIWMCLTDGKQFVGGDIVGGASGTKALNYRDAVLNITENFFLVGGGFFTVPGSVGTIRAMRFASTLDASLGQGPLQIFTPTTVFSCQAPVDRLTWQSVTNPILTESLIGSGAMGQDSTIGINGDTMFRSLNGLRSLILARRDFDTWGNVPLSREIERVLNKDAQNLLPWGSAAYFDNRLLMTSAPTVSDPAGGGDATARGVYHQGLVALNFDPISSLRGKSESVYDGSWPGFNILQLVTGEFALTQRCYFFALNPDQAVIELHELLTSADSASADNGGLAPINWWFETPTIFQEADQSKRAFKRLLNGEIFVDQLIGQVDFTVQYRPDDYPCWINWLSWSECASTVNNGRMQFRPKLGLGEPSSIPCDPITNRPFREGFYFQVKIIVQGQCRFKGARFMAITIPDGTFTPPACDAICDSGITQITPQ